jgi:phage-related protein
MKPVVWVGSSRSDIREFPDPVQDEMGYALYLAQQDGKHPEAKPLRGHHGAGVLEVVESFDGNAYRAVYTVRFAGAIYVLHCFQKKSTHGIAMPRREEELIGSSLALGRRAPSELYRSTREVRSSG